MLTPDTRVAADRHWMGPIGDDGEITEDARTDHAVFTGLDAEANCLRVAACVSACMGVKTETLVQAMERGYLMLGMAERISSLLKEREQARSEAKDV